MAKKKRKVARTPISTVEMLAVLPEKAMAIDSKEKWNPLSRTRFDEILAAEVASLPQDALKTYESHRIDVVKQTCHRSEQYGIEHVFVVARAGVRLLLFDDAEDEFAVGEVDTDGVLRKWDLYGELLFALRNLTGQ